jgi:hypothetical protein
MHSQNYKKRTLTFRHRGKDFLTVQAVPQMHDAILKVSGGLSGVREMGLLESGDSSL